MGSEVGKREKASSIVTREFRCCYLLDFFGRVFVR
ncbi:unnamed protein product [Rhodiola kirilowii]